MHGIGAWVMHGMGGVHGYDGGGLGGREGGDWVYDPGARDPELDSNAPRLGRRLPSGSSKHW